MDPYPYGRPAWPRWTSPIWWLYVLAVLCSCALTLDAEDLERATAPLAEPIPLRESDEMLYDFARAGRQPRVREQGRGATVLPGELLLPPDWHERDEQGRQRLLAHEWTHVVQDVRPARYALDRRYRAACEVQAIVEQGRAAVRQGLDAGACREIVTEKIEALPDRYALTMDQAWMRGTLIPMATRRACGE